MYSLPLEQANNQAKIDPSDLWVSLSVLLEIVFNIHSMFLAIYIYYSNH